MIHILIADDHMVVRKGLKQILLEEFLDANVEEASNGNELLKKINLEKWNIVICDLSMPGRGGLEVLKQLKQEQPRLPVLILSMHPEDQYAIRVLRAGASGYLTKESAPAELVKAVKQILNGRKYITESMAEKLATGINQGNSESLHATLSDREFAVFKLIASGKTVSEIAEILSLSVPTVSTYRARMLEKMNMKNNSELTHYAVQQGLV